VKENKQCRRNYAFRIDLVFNPILAVFA